MGGGGGVREVREVRVVREVVCIESHMKCNVNIYIKQFNRTSLSRFVVCESLGVFDRMDLYFHPKESAMKGT